MIQQFDKSPVRTPFLHWGFLFLLFLQPVATQAETYYVAVTGKDSNPGTLDQPWRHPQKCVDPDSPLVAGDTCLVRNGTYTDTDDNGIVIYVRTTAPSATASAPITLKSENPLGAVISLPNYTGVATGIFLAKSNYIIDGFDISGGIASGATASSAGITVARTSNTIIRGNAIHGQGWGACTNSPYGNSGLYFILGSSNITVEYNTIHHVGRLRNGESKCSTDKYHHDHGIYSAGATNVTIRRNVFYEVNRGYPLHIYKSGGATHGNIFIYNNTISGKSPTGRPAGQVALCNTLENVQIKNNIFHDPPLDHVIHYCAVTPAATGLVISHNLTNGTRNDFQNPNSKPPTGVTYSNNKTNIDPKFADAESHNYKLLSTSPAINAGTNVGLLYTGNAPDIGAYEFSEQDNKEPLRPVDVRIQ